MIKCEVKNFTLSAAEYENIPCTPPCSLYSVFLDKGYVDSAFVSEREGRYSLGGIKNCVFSATVKLNRGVVSSKYVYLSLDKIMAKAEVLVNGKSFGVIDNANRRFFFEIGDIAVEGDNEVTLRCSEPLPFYEKVSQYEPSYACVPDLGILGGVEIVATNHGIIRSVGVSQSHENGKVNLTVSLSTLGACSELNSVITLVSPVGKVYFGAIRAGLGTVSVPDPVLWWPHTMGTPNLYKLTVSLYSHGEVEDSAEFQVGLRELSAEFGDGGSLALRINGRPFLALGGEYCKENVVLPLIKKENTEALIKLAVKARVNTFKAGFFEAYPFEDFYTLCDKYGIVVWQDLYINYETSLVDTAFVMTKREELDWVVCALSRHPSVIVSNLSVVKECGSPDISDGALAEFIDAAKRITLPIYGAYMPEGKLYFENEGTYPSDELPYGKSDVISIPDMKTLRSFANEDVNILSPKIEERVGYEGAIGDMLSELSYEYRYAYDTSSLIYLSQLSTARKMERSVEKMRKERSFVTTAIFRRFNDSYPALTPSRVDFFLREKALNYATRRFFSPVIPIVEVSGECVSLGVCCDGLKPYEGKLTCALYTSDDKCVTENSFAVTVDGGSYVSVGTLDYSKYINGEVEDFYIAYELSGEKVVDFEGVRLFTPAKKFNLKKPEITKELKGAGKEFELTLKARALALGIEISAEELDLRLSDNYFDLREGVAVKVKITTDSVMAPEALESLIKVRSLYDVGR